MGDVPLAVRVWLYAMPTVPFGSEAVVMVGAVGAAVMVMLSDFAAELFPAVSVAVTVKL
ncbi:MAG: hypothetical protein VB106_04385 [Clostridiaceae bacterium]|nr:hypothetical protein [Clostridiaceae bacterium]